MRASCKIMRVRSEKALSQIAYWAWQISTLLTAGKAGLEAVPVARAPSRTGYLPFFEAALTAPALLEALVFF